MAVSIQEFEKALASLSEAIDFFEKSNDEVTKKIARDACIQRFEFCIELAWKTSGRVLGSASIAANTVLREMARENLIADPEVWFGFIAARNQTSHTYDEQVATIVFQAVRDFVAHGDLLLKALKQK